MADTIDAGFFNNFKPKTTKEITKNQTEEHDSSTYNCNYSSKGHALIFNHYEFDHSFMPKRQGTHADAKTLENTFNNLGFTVWVHNDLKFSSIESELLKVAQMDHTNNESLVVIVMSHGNNGVISARDCEYKPQELWLPFAGNNCKSLAGKPKLFFIQACRGDKIDSGSHIEHDGARTKKYTYVPEMADILVMYSTYTGYYSWRDPVDGSWFIQALCAVLANKKWNRKDLLTLLTYVNHLVAFHFKSVNRSDRNLDGKKQVGTVVSTLRKLYYINSTIKLDT